MKLRRFGRTGIDISELVFGGGFVGGILIHADDDTRREAIRRALAGGINWIDTAPSYGQGRLAAPVQNEWRPPSFVGILYTLALTVEEPNSDVWKHGQQFS